MSDEQINRAIAEACGWREGVERYVQNLPLMKAQPDYCNDLNAMHEAEKVLISFNKERDFWFQLRELLEFPDAESDWDGFYFFEAIHATARERAEAFLRTLGKWEEVQA